MTQSKQGKQQIVIASPEGQQSALRAILDLPLADAWVVKIEPHRARRRLNANALYWAWLTQMADHFSRRGGKFTRDDLHDVMRHKHLGYTEERTIGQTVIPPCLRSTSTLSVEEFCEYMTRIDTWAQDHGCYLTTPEMSQYAEYKEARQ